MGVSVLLNGTLKQMGHMRHSIDVLFVAGIVVAVKKGEKRLNFPVFQGNDTGWIGRP